MLLIREASDVERASANAQYASIRFALTSPDDLQLVAELDGERVGLGRLVALDDAALELGGIWTSERSRGRGIARAVVERLIAAAGPRELWCVPFEHLVAFYASFGFDRTASPWPAAIARKVDACSASALPAVAVLRRRDP